MSRISGSGTGSFATAVDIGSKSWPFVIAPEPRYTHRRAEFQELCLLLTRYRA